MTSHAFDAPFSAVHPSVTRVCELREAIAWSIVHWMDQFGSKKYKAILDELANAGCDLSSINDVRTLYVILGKAKGYTFPERFLPSVTQSRRALKIYNLTKAFIDLSKPVGGYNAQSCPEDGIVPPKEDLMALASQAKRDLLITKMFLTQKGKCHYCGCDMHLSFADKFKPEYATVDHIIPRCQGGTKSSDNVVASCARCNCDKAATPYHQFITRTRTVRLH